MRARTRAVFGLDLRSLGMLRVGTALTLLVDLLTRIQFIGPHYTDEGILPRALLHEILWTSPLELHALGGSAGFELCLFLVAIVAAAFLLVGYWTKVATVVSWLLLTSLHFRNPYILFGMDHLLRVTLFWGIFLPLGARFSLDARRAEERPANYVSPVSAAYIAQIAIIYLIAGLAKSGDQWRVSGNAVQWVLLDTRWVWPYVDFLLQFPALLRCLTFSTVALEIATPLLLFCPFFSGQVRTLTVLSLLVLQTGLGLAMKLWLFPVVNVVVLLALLPTWFWDRIASPSNHSEVAEVSAPQRPGGVSSVRIAASVLVSVVLVWVLAVNLSSFFPSTLPPKPLFKLGWKLGLYQRWELYGPSPRRVDIEPTFVVTERSGAQFAKSDEGPGPRWQAMHALERDYRQRVFTSFSLDLGIPNHEKLRSGYADWLCRQWNADAPPERVLREVQLISILRRLKLNGEVGEGRGYVELRYACTAGEGSGS